MRLFFAINHDLDSNFDSYKLYNNVGEFKKAVFFFGFLKRLLQNFYFSSNSKNTKYAISK